MMETPPGDPLGDGARLAGLRGRLGAPVPGLVSIVVIFRDAEPFLEDAIRSVFAQTYSAWELLLVDDGSSDRSTEVARAWRAAHPARVRYLAHEGRSNRGMSASRNLGIAHARGEYVAMLDADDVWMPEKLEQQVAILRARPEVALVYGRRQYWSSWAGGAGPADDPVSHLGVEPGSVLRPPGLLARAFARPGVVWPCPSDLLFRRDMAMRIDGFEEAFRGVYAMYEDKAFLVKVGLHETVYVADECWTRYRQHPDSCVSTVVRAGQDSVAREFFLRWFEAYLRTHGGRGSPAWRWVRRVLWTSRHPVVCDALRRVGRVGRGIRRRIRLGAPRTR